MYTFLFALLVMSEKLIYFQIQIENSGILAFYIYCLFTVNTFKCKFNYQSHLLRENSDRSHFYNRLRNGMYQKKTATNFHSAVRFSSFMINQNNLSFSRSSINSRNNYLYIEIILPYNGNKIIFTNKNIKLFLLFPSSACIQPEKEVTFKRNLIHLF